MSLEIITELSHRYGADPAFVLAGGGNTSYKDEKTLYVKPSGVSLAAIAPSDFVPMDRTLLRQCFDLGPFADNAERERRVKALMHYAVLSDDGKRPSVEAPLHELLPFKFVVHTHPALVNAMTCGKAGKEAAAKLFPEALWIDYVDPGFTLAREVLEKGRAFHAAHGKAPQIVFLQNHGVFVGADRAEEIDTLYAHLTTELEAYVKKQNVPLDWNIPAPDGDAVFSLGPQLRGLLGTPATVASTGFFPLAAGALTPDHIVYAKSFGLVADAPDDAAVAEFEKKYGCKPRMVSIPGKANFFAGATKENADTAMKLAINGAHIVQLAAAFGGVRYLSDAERGFIENWEVESYRAKVAAGAAGPLRGKVALVTGGAQGFGYGIARELAEMGADVVIADMNVEGAKKAAAELGPGASGFAVNIASEPTVESLVREVVAAYGGVDILVANAGVVRAGSVKTFALKDWEFVTDINYNGFFLCCKHFAALMARQNQATGSWTDIVQVNSKSGLEGSKNNGAYAGSKFGALGLIQSFALELVADRIKINAVCPGNYLDGPLWSDPERGLFVQYLKAGKVSGAKTVADVRAYYEGKVPMNRGCFPADVARAIVYAVEQQYETGQAIPVTGGQVMLN